MLHSMERSGCSVFLNSHTTTWGGYPPLFSYRQQFHNALELLPSNYVLKTTELTKLVYPKIADSL